MMVRNGDRGVGRLWKQLEDVLSARVKRKCVCVSYCFALVRATMRSFLGLTKYTLTHSVYVCVCVCVCVTLDDRMTKVVETSSLSSIHKSDHTHTHTHTTIAAPQLLLNTSSSLSLPAFLSPSPSPRCTTGSWSGWGRSAVSQTSARPSSCTEGRPRRRARTPPWWGSSRYWPTPRHLSLAASSNATASPPLL